MDYELFISGTPNEFMAMLREFSYQTREHKDPYYWNVIQHNANDNPQYALLDPYTGQDDPMVILTAHALPGQRTRLILRHHGDEADWIRYKPAWDALLIELQRQGWAEPDLTVNEQKKDLGLLPATTMDLPADFILRDVQKMKALFPDYSVQTAVEIYKAIPAAYGIYRDEGGRWGAGYISKIYSLNPTSIGRYLKAMKTAGIIEYIQDGQKIPLP